MRMGAAGEHQKDESQNGGSEEWKGNVNQGLF